jgi:hypothetical protein
MARLIDSATQTEPTARKRSATVAILSWSAFLYASVLAVIWFASLEDPMLVSRQNYKRGGPLFPNTPSLSPNGKHLVCDAFGRVTGRVF